MKLHLSISLQLTPHPSITVSKLAHLFPTALAFNSNKPLKTARNQSDLNIKKCLSSLYYVSKSHVPVETVCATHSTAVPDMEVPTWEPCSAFLHIRVSFYLMLHLKPYPFQMYPLHNSFIY